jgi:hypothetical protein
MYCFRARLRLDPRNRINVDADELVLADDVAGIGRVVLLARSESPMLLSQAEELVLRGEGYESEVEAEEAASRWVAGLRVALAGSLIGADFGRRGPAQHITPAGLEWLKELLLSTEGSEAARRVADGSLVVQDIHGTQIYECEPRPVFAALDLGLLVQRSPERLLRLIGEATEKKMAVHDTEELAFELFSGSFFEPSADGRFLMLMMAVEVLTDPARRGEAATTHVDQLIAATHGAGLGPEETESLVNALGNLKRESINRAGQRLAETLGSRSYLEQSPANFFKQCYGLRSRLVHGNQPYPTFDDVNVQAGALELFVRDLLLLVAGELSAEDEA